MEEYKRYKQNYNIKLNTSKYSTGKTEYKKVEKRTISINSGINNTRYNQYTSMANKNYLNNKDNKSIKSKSFTTYKSTTNQTNLNKSFNSKQKFSYADKVQEKNNYIYYVSGVGYVNKNEENKTEKKITKANLPPRPKPNPINRTNQIKIQIQHKRVNEQSRKELVDNYQYHETKSLKKDNNKGTVSHKRLCEPVYSYTNKTTKKFSSHTEQPRTSNKSFQRKEYEIPEQKRPVKQITNTNITNITNNSNINNRTQRLSRQIDNKYNTSRQGSYNNRNYKNVSENKRQNSSYVRKEENTRTKNNYVYTSRDISSDRNKNYIRNSNINNNSLKRDNKVIIRNNETRSNRNYNQSFNNIQKHEIKAVSKDKKIVNNYTHNKSNTNIRETKKYYPRVTRESNITQKYTNTNINTNINTNTIRRNVYDSQTQAINQRIKTVYNISNKPRHTAEVIDYRRNNRNNRINYTLAPVKQIEHNYEFIRGDNIPQHSEQFAIYEAQRMNQYNQNYPSNIQIHFSQRSQNIPQTVQEIHVHEKKEIMPQHVQQIEVYEGNNNNQENIEQNIEKNEEDYQNIEEDNIENIENIEKNYEQQEEVKEEQVNIDNIDNIDNIENNGMVEHEEKNMDNMEEIKNIEQNNLNEIEQDNEMNDNNENMEQMEEKEGNIQIQNTIPMEEKDENEEENNKFQMYDQYISQENINTSDDQYQLNQGQYMNNEFNNENNYINFCPIHGIIHNQYNQNIIYNMNRQFNQNNREVMNNAQIGEDGMVWVGNTNNYKFYESKNIKNKDGEVNSLTLHHLRGEEKYSNKKNMSNASNVYVATKVVPVMTDSNVSNFEEYHSGTGNNFTNDENETHDENCPIHGDKNINEQE